MLVLALFSHELPLFYVSYPDVEDRVYTSLEALVYSSVPEIGVRTSFLSRGYIAMLTKSNGYTLGLITNCNNIVGFYKEILPELRAALVPYEGQDPSFLARQYGLVLIGYMKKTYVYLPRRIMRDKEILYKRVVADLGHTSFGILFEEYAIVFNRKGAILGEISYDESSEKISSENVLKLAKMFGKNPIGLVLQTENRSKLIPLRALRGRLDL